MQEPQPHRAIEEQTMQESIARLAYALWEERGRQDGSPEKDWFQAEAALQDGRSR